jgi:hypothetical protein
MSDTTAVYNETWTRPVTFRMNVTCDFDPFLQLINGPPGMVLKGTTLEWEPEYYMLGNTYPVTLRFTVDYFDPPHTTVETGTFHITVVEHSEVDMDVDFRFNPDCSSTSTAVTMKAFLKNDSNAYITVSGKVYVDSYEMGTFTNMTLSPDENTLAWSHYFPIHGDGVYHEMCVEFTDSSIPLREGYDDNSYCEGWRNVCY